MVEHITRNPDAVAITEAEVASPPLERRGFCLICGSWLEVDGDQDAYAVTLARGEADVSEHVAHTDCLARVAHPSANLAGLASAAKPENHLASKFLTPSGR